jgi:hypothetical protein
VPAASGTLTYVSGLGAGDHTITYTAVTATNNWRDSFVLNPKSGVGTMGGTLTIVSNVNVGINGGIGVLRVNNNQWNASDDLNRIDLSQGSRVHQAFATNFNATQSGTGVIDFSTPGSYGFGQDGTKLTIYGAGTLLADADNNGANTWRDRVDTFHYPNTPGWGSFGRVTEFFGYSYIRTNFFVTANVGNLTATNAPTFTTTNAIPAGASVTGGVLTITTNDYRFITITNGGLTYSVWAIKN